MILPKDFDQNEWFVILWLIITIFVVLILPKRFPRSIMTLIFIFSSTEARLFDHILSFPKLDLYDVMDGPTFELFDLLVYVLYAPFGYFFIYFYDRLDVRGCWIVFYIIICSIGGTVYEWIAEYFHVFTYKGWHTSYSFTIYLITQSTTLLFYKYIKSVRQISIVKKE